MDENDSLNINGVNKFKIIQKKFKWGQMKYNKDMVKMHKKYQIKL